VTPENPQIWQGRGLPPGEFHGLSRVTTQADRTLWSKASNFLFSLWGALAVIRRVRPDAIVCIASSVAVPLCIWGRLFGKKTVFVESITRVSRPSTTGRILDALRLCDRFYVQWPEAVPLYRRAIYRGTVL
jgi:UDP-N-acetylglucosamine:LPS N-acetylglucosamine transferase